jgi:uncharacterized phiE125 gp8 family phage protein
MRLALSTAPATDAITIAEAREWLNFVPGAVEDDSVLESLIDEVYDYLEHRLNRKICTQTWKLYLDECEVLSEIRVPLVPLVSVSSTGIKATDSDDVQTTVTSTNFQVIAGENPRIVLTDDGEWPTDLRDYECLEITAIAGYNGNKGLYVGFQPFDVTMSGLNDMKASGTFTGTTKTTFEIVITSTNLTSGSPSTTADVFKWRKITRSADGVKTYGTWTTSVKITAAAQTLTDGVSVAFDALTGHSQDDKWTVQVHEILPRKIKMILKGLVLHFHTTKGRGVMETISGQLIGTPRILDYMIESMRVVPL